MKIFISWSKDRSKYVAEALAEWLPDVIQSLDPWVSTTGISAGSRWNNVIAEQLATTKFGIICVTKKNQFEPWIQFEAGALAKTLDAETRVCPYLIDFGDTSLSASPLTAFNYVTADEDGTRKLIRDINSALELGSTNRLSDERLDRTFKRVWPDLQLKLENLPEETDKVKSPKPGTDAMIQEILEISRENSRNIAHIRDLNSLNTNQISNTFRSTSDSIRDNKHTFFSFEIDGSKDDKATFSHKLSKLLSLNEYRRLQITVVSGRRTDTPKDMFSFKARDIDAETINRLISEVLDIAQQSKVNIETFY